MNISDQKDLKIDSQDNLIEDRMIFNGEMRKKERGAENDRERNQIKKSKQL